MKAFVKTEMSVLRCLALKNWGEVNRKTATSAVTLSWRRSGPGWGSLILLLFLIFLPPHVIITSTCTLNPLSSHAQYTSGFGSVRCLPCSFFLAVACLKTSFLSGSLVQTDTSAYSFLLALDSQSLRFFSCLKPLTSSSFISMLWVDDFALHLGRQT